MAGTDYLSSLSSTGGTVNYQNPAWLDEYLQSVAGAGTTLTGNASTPGSIASNMANWNINPATGQPNALYGDWNSAYDNQYTGANAATGPGGYLTQASNAMTRASNDINGVNTGLDNISSSIGNISSNLGTTAAGYNPINANAAGVSSNLGTTSAGLNGVSSSIPGMTTYDPSKMSQFMNPYTQNAAAATTNLSNKNLFESILPKVNSTFIGSGQFGSTRNADFENRAIRDQQQALTNTIGGLNYDATKSAAQNYEDWAKLGLSGAETQRAIASTQGDLAGRQLTADQLQQQGLTGQADVYGKQLDAAGRQTTAQQYQAQNDVSQAGIAKDQAALGTQNLTNLGTAGKNYLDWQNGGLGATYTDFQNQLKYPIDALGALTNVTNSLKGQTQPSTNVTPGEMTEWQKAAAMSQLLGQATTSTNGGTSTLDDIATWWKSIFGG